MMEMVALLKGLAQMGMSLPALIALGILWKISQQFGHLDKRVSIVESKQEMIIGGIQVSQKNRGNGA